MLRNHSPAPQAPPPAVIPDALPHSCAAEGGKEAEDFPVVLDKETGMLVRCCRFCPFRTQYPSALKQHERIHTGDKPFQCSVCDFRSSQKCHVQRHEGRHGIAHVALYARTAPRPVREDGVTAARSSTIPAAACLSKPVRARKRRTRTKPRELAHEPKLLPHSSVGPTLARRGPKRACPPQPSPEEALLEVNAEASPPPALSQPPLPTGPIVACVAACAAFERPFPPAPAAPLPFPSPLRAYVQHLPLPWQDPAPGGWQRPQFPGWPPQLMRAPMVEAGWGPYLPSWGQRPPVLMYTHAPRWGDPWAAATFPR